MDFPADYRATELAGKQAIFNTEVKAVEEPTLPELDEEFCASFGVTEGGIAEAARGRRREHAESRTASLVPRASLWSAWNTPRCRRTPVPNRFLRACPTASYRSLRNSVPSS